MSQTTNVPPVIPPLRRNRPPTVAEQEEIMRQVAQDDAISDYLLVQLTQRRHSLAQAQSRIDQKQVALAEAEQRLTTAARLHDFFLQRNQVPLPLESSLSAAQSTTPSVIHAAGRRQHYDSLLAVTETFVSAAQEILEKASLAVEEAKDAVSLQREEIQAAMTTTVMQEEGIAVLEMQIGMLKEASEKKLDAFRPIWKVPREVWQLVFAEAAREEEHNLAKEDIGTGIYRGNGRLGCETLRLSGVCYGWRSLILSVPDLWNHIFIRNDLDHYDIKRIEHYYRLCNTSRLAITICSTTTLGVTPFKPLLGRFNHNVTCRAITLLLCAPGVPTVNILLPFLPAPCDLSIIRFSIEDSVERTPAPTIPTSFCRSVRNLYISAAGAHWQDESVMQVQDYFITAPLASAIFGPHRFVPSSIASLTVIGIQGRLYDRDPPLLSARTCLPNVRETLMDLDFLVNVFMRHYTLPSLTKITIPNGSHVDADAWEASLAELDGSADSGIREVSVFSFDNDIDSLVDCLVTLTHLETLELYYGSIDLTLEMLEQKVSVNPKLLPSLTSLVLHSYAGTGRSILALLKAMAKCDDEEAIETLMAQPILRIVMRNSSSLGKKMAVNISKLAIIAC